jgi:two-component system LytT family sensor kinase
VEVRKDTYYRLVKDDDTLFWLLQSVGWIGISLLTYLSLSVPYDQYELSYLAHNVTQSLVGFALSTPLRYLYRAIWNWGGYVRVAVVLGSAILLAVLWAAARLQVFMMMTGETGVWNDFGGWLFPSLFVFFTWAALYHGIKYFQFLQREQEIAVRAESAQRQEALKRMKAEAQTKAAQLQLLRYQLNPHFLFNTLNAVSSLITAARGDDANSMLLKLSTFLRFALERDDMTLTTLREELMAIELYLDIEKVRFSDRLTVSFEVSPDAYRCSVPSLLLQPIVENAIKYAIAQSEEGGRIRIGARCGEGRLWLEIDDTGPDNPPEKKSQDMTSEDVSGVGIGLQNIRDRLATLYGEHCSVTHEPSPLGGRRVSIAIPAAEQYELAS